MGYEETQINANFGHMLKALSYGAPPHGGIAWGLDRFVTILQNESSIRDVIPFAKTGEGRDLMMDAPSEISQKQLQELGERESQLRRSSRVTEGYAQAERKHYFIQCW